jgi:hypothetical protein
MQPETASAFIEMATEMDPIKLTKLAQELAAALDTHLLNPSPKSATQT